MSNDTGKVVVKKCTHEKCPICNGSLIRSRRRFIEFPIVYANGLVDNDGKLAVPNYSIGAYLVIVTCPLCDWDQVVQFRDETSPSILYEDNISFFGEESYLKLVHERAALIKGEEIGDYALSQEDLDIIVGVQKAIDLELHIISKEIYKDSITNNQLYNKARDDIKELGCMLCTLRHGGKIDMNKFISLLSKNGVNYGDCENVYHESLKEKGKPS